MFGLCVLFVIFISFMSSLFSFTSLADVCCLRDFFSLYLRRNCTCSFRILHQDAGWKGPTSLNTRTTSQASSCVGTSTTLEKVTLQHSQLFGGSNTPKTYNKYIKSHTQSHSIHITTALTDTHTYTREEHTESNQQYELHCQVLVP